MRNAQGKTHAALRQALADAARQRFRPILMTTLAMALGSLPIALGLGAASKSRVPMGVAIIGGLLFALVLTLFVVPALYSYMASGSDQPAVPSTGEGPAPAQVST